MCSLGSLLLLTLCVSVGRCALSTWCSRASLGPPWPRPAGSRDGSVIGILAVASSALFRAQASRTLHVELSLACLAGLISRPRRGQRHRCLEPGRGPPGGKCLSTVIKVSNQDEVLQDTSVSNRVEDLRGEMSLCGHQGAEPGRDPPGSHRDDPAG